MARTTAARYYVRFDSYWQGSRDYFAGPFESREAAEAAINAIDTEDNVWLSTSTCGGDIRTAYRVYPKVLTATEAKRAGMRDDYGHKHNTVDRLPSREYDPFDVLNAILEVM